jgi:IclR family transcriptional regulator, mhp operon transcriptional activator
MAAGQVQSVVRAFALLEELNRHRVVSLHALHRATGLPKPTVVRLLKTLSAMGFVVNDRRQGGYAVGARVKWLSSGYNGDPLVIEASRPWTLAFTSEHQWPLAVGVLDGPAVVVGFTTTGDSPVAPLQNFINRRLSLISRAMGRAYLAFCPLNERRVLLELISRNGSAEDKRSLKRGEVDSMIRTVRRHGYAERHPSLDPGSSTIAVPIMIGDRVQATLGMTFFTSVVPRLELARHYVPKLKTVARSIATTVSSLRQQDAQ